MKKENRKAAQERKAEQRKKQALQKKLNSIALIVVPILAIALLVGVFLWVGSKDQNQDDSYLTDKTLTVKDGDTIHLDYVGTINGEEFSGGSTQGNGTTLTIGSGSYIDDFEEQLIGAHPGDTVTVEVTFPEKYHNASLAGKDAVFEVVVNGIYP